ncbi:MAG: DUF3365 domain-containing protein [Gallionellaceae bacterium]|nr:DUF3365 domain-containing protein [Gallionellaceae bacterium]
MKKSIALSALFVLATSAAYAADDISKLKEESIAVIGPFAKQLSEANQKAVKEGGPASAIVVCKDIAPAMAGEISRNKGWKLSRVSLKVRNPLLGTPDAWEQKTLQDFEARYAKGEKPETIAAAEIVDEPAGKSFRFMKAVALQQGCLGCHGTPEQISPEVKASLAKDYPNDKATGYSVGQIRGAVSIKRPL